MGNERLHLHVGRDGERFVGEGRPKGDNSPNRQVTECLEDALHDRPLTLRQGAQAGQHQRPFLISVSRMPRPVGVMLTDGADVAHVLGQRNP